MAYWNASATIPSIAVGFKMTDSLVRCLTAYSIRRTFSQKIMCVTHSHWWIEYGNLDPISLYQDFRFLIHREQIWLDIESVSLTHETITTRVWLVRLLFPSSFLVYQITKVFVRYVYSTNRLVTLKTTIYLTPCFGKMWKSWSLSKNISHLCT